MVRRNTSKREKINKRRMANAVGFPFDWEFMIDVEMEKLKQMLAYFEKSNITENNPIVVRDLKLAINLCVIIKQEGYRQPCWSGGIPAVNYNNKARFFKRYMPTDLSISSLARIRTEKAWSAYHNLKKYRMRTWWD